MTADTRDRILDACARVISRSGLSGFRMQDVAGEAGVSIGLLSYHFEDRDGLLQAALDHVNAGAVHRAGMASNARTASGRLAALLSAEFGDAPEVREGSTAWNELRAAAVFSSGRATALARSTAEWQRSVVRLLEEASPESDVEQAALILTSLVEGLSGRWLTGQITAEEARGAVEHAVLRFTEEDA